MGITKARAQSVRLGLTFSFVLQGSVNTLMIPRIPELIDQLHVNFAAWGAIIGFAGMGGLLGLMFASRLIVSFGSRRILQVSAIAFALSLVPLPYISNPWIFFILQAAMAIAGSCLNVALSAQAVVLQKHLKRTIIPKFHGGWSIGAAGSAALSAFMASFLPMWLHFLVVPLIIAGGFVWSTSRAFTSEEIGLVVERKTSKHVPFWKSPTLLWVLSAGWFAGVFPELAIMDWSTVFGRKVLEVDAAMSTLPYTFFVVAMIISRLSIARVTRGVHIGIASFWGGIVGAIAMGLGIVLGPLVADHDKIAGVFVTASLWFIAGLGIGPMAPTFTSAAGQVKGLSTSQGLARASLVGSLAITGGKLLMGAIAQGVSLIVAFALPTALLFVAGVIAGVWAKSEIASQAVIEDAFPITGAIPIASIKK
jgi:MFS family permease